MLPLAVLDNLREMVCCSGIMLSKWFNNFQKYTVVDLFVVKRTSVGGGGAGKPLKLLIG